MTKTGGSCWQSLILYEVIILDPHIKIEGMKYGLKLVHGTLWADLVGGMVRNTLFRLFDDFLVIKDGSAPIPTTPTALSPSNANMEKKHRLASAQILL